MAENEGRRKAKSKGFAELGIPAGAVLAYRKDPSVTATALDGKNKVEYKGKAYSISALAKELAGTPVSGYQAFMYGGVLLAKLGGSGGDAAGEPAPQTAGVSEKPQNAAEEAAPAPLPQASAKPQTVPLPMPQRAPSRGTGG